jgi:hypothetical protein
VRPAERLFFHVLDSAGRITQNLDVNTSAERLVFPQWNREVLAARDWLAIELDFGMAYAAGLTLEVT